MNKTMYLMMILSDKINECFKENKKSKGLKSLDFQYALLIMIIYANGGSMQIKSIYQLISKPKSTITEMIKKLVRDGYLMKEKDAKDRRISFVKVTEFADERKSIFIETTSAIYKNMVKDFSDSEKDELKRLLSKAIKNI